jgi:CheY-like chemotaxis protein
MRKINLMLRIESDVPKTVQGDETRLTQVLMNLIGNGLKFHPKTRTAEIMVSVSKVESSIQFDVSDNGIGIPEIQQGKLFQQFVQLGDETTRLYGGTGLGLSICKNFVESMGGHLWLQHSQPDKGSIFSFQIPIRERSDVCVSPIAVEDLPRKRSLSSADLSGIKVLVAEDNAINRKVIKKMLESIGLVAIVLVEDGLQALREFMNQQFDLVILDVGMPIMSGIQAAIAMREYENKTNVRFRTPIMACTADVTISKQEECFNAGMDHVAIKPIVKETLKHIIVKLTQEEEVS